MPLIPLENFGKFGVVSDLMSASLPIGTWTDARNMRFSGNQMEKMLEPEMLHPFDYQALGTPQWMQAWSDGISSYLTLATQTDLFFLEAGGEGETGSWLNVSKSPGGYSPEGIWDSFAWGDTCIYNNGVDPPQIFNVGLLKFEDLPRWGMISSAEDIADFLPPSINTFASCKIIKPYKNMLVAHGITEAGTIYQPNLTWWSDFTDLSTYSTALGEQKGPPSWDYESPETASGRSEVGVGYGSITCASNLNENQVIYTDNSATLMSFVGGTFIMSFRRLFNKGAAGQKCAVEFNNQHFVLSRDQMYLHDGSAVRLIAKDRVEEAFFRKIGKPGRFGGSDPIDWEAVQVVQNADRKEIYIIYNRLVDDPPVIIEPGFKARVDPMFFAGIDWNGYHSNYGMVAADPTGQYILINHKGYGCQMLSTDSGASFTVNPPTPPHSAPGPSWDTGDSTNYPNPTTVWSPFHNAFMVNLYRHDPTRQCHWARLSIANVWTTVYMEGSYNRALWVDPINGNFFYGSGGSGPAQILRNAPHDANIIYSGSGPTNSPSVILEIAPGQLFLGNSREGGDEPWRAWVTPKNMSGEGLYYGANFTNIHRCATSGTGTLLARKSVSGNEVRFDKLVYTGVANALELVIVNFGTPVSLADHCWSAGVNGFVVVAIDASDNQLLHIRYSDGENTGPDSWRVVESVYLSGYPEPDDSRQIRWLKGNEYTYSYIQFLYEKTSPSGHPRHTVDKITFGAEQGEELIVPIVKSHFDAENYGVFGANTYSSELPASPGGRINVSAALVPTSAANAKYGTAAITNYTSNSYGVYADPVILDPNNFTLEMYYAAAPQTTPIDAGLFFYGERLYNHRVQGGVMANGSVQFQYATGYDTFYQIQTAAGVINNTASSTYAWREICFEADNHARKARIYVDGVMLAEAPMTRSKWNGLNTLHINYARLWNGAATNDRYAKGRTDEIKVSNGPLYKGEGYIKHEAPF